MSLFNCWEFQGLGEGIPKIKRLVFGGHGVLRRRWLYLGSYPWCLCSCHYHWLQHRLWYVPGCMFRRDSSPDAIDGMTAYLLYCSYIDIARNIKKRIVMTNQQQALDYLKGNVSIHVRISGEKNQKLHKTNSYE